MPLTKDQPIIYYVSREEKKELERLHRVEQVIGYTRKGFKGKRFIQFCATLARTRLKRREEIEETSSISEFHLNSFHNEAFLISDISAPYNIQAPLIPNFPAPKPKVEYKRREIEELLEQGLTETQIADKTGYSQSWVNAVNRCLQQQQYKQVTIQKEKEEEEGQFHCWKCGIIVKYPYPPKVGYKVMCRNCKYIYQFQLDFPHFKQETISVQVDNHKLPPRPKPPRKFRPLNSIGPRRPNVVDMIYE